MTYNAANVPVTGREVSIINVAYRRFFTFCHMLHRSVCQLATYWSTRAWFTVDEAATMLRVRRNTLYDLCRSGEFPCSRWGGTDDDWFIRIPAEALGFTVKPETRSRTYHVTDSPEQMELPLGPFVPVRRFRNTREIIEPFHYESALYAQRVRRTPEN